MRALARRNGDVSFWQASLPAPLRRPPLPGDCDAGVCIAGAGFTGLWTAYHLKRARPDLEVVVLEREHVGYGASGRNGGWLTPAFAGPRARLLAAHGPAAVRALERALRESVADVLAVCAQEGIDCDALAGGVLRVARGQAQAARLRAAVAAERTWEGDACDSSSWRATRSPRGCASLARTAAPGAPHGVRVQPAKLVRGLAQAAERRGVRIFEDTAVRELRAAGAQPGAARGGGRAPATSAAALSDRGVVRAPVVLAASRASRRRCAAGGASCCRSTRRSS